MDNYFDGCPPMMDDGGRLFCDFRSSQVREELFRYKNCVYSENEARTLRIENADEIMDTEWNKVRATKSCFPTKVCFHKSPTTRVTTNYNNAEILAYNGDLPAPLCDVDCYDYRMTFTTGSRKPKPGCKHSANSRLSYAGYPANRCPERCVKTNRIRPEKLYPDDQ
jgi:hypothetical protein